jgi:hypothetical protein
VSLRIEAGTATNGGSTNRDTPSASHATGISSTQFCQNVYVKPGALFSVNRLSDAEAQMGSSASVSSAERWSGNPDPTNMRRSHRMGAPPKPVYMHDLKFMGVAQKWFSA